MMQKRSVQTIYMMFGEVGGLHGFLVLILSVFLKYYNSQLLLASLAQKLFHGAPKVASNYDSSTSTTLQEVTFNPLSFTASFVLAQSYIMSCCYRDKYSHRKTLLDGMSRVEDSLDIVKLIRSYRALNTLLRLLMTKDERRLLRL